MSIDTDNAEFAEKLTFATECAAIALTEMVKKNHAGIMAVRIVFGAWISQAHNHFESIAWHRVTRLVIFA